MTTITDNLDPAELAKFDRMAADWWDPDGPCRPLHDLNPCRADYVCADLPAGSRLLDVGCGGGILSEALAARGMRVTGIDADRAMIETARRHALSAAATVDYELATAEQAAAQHPATFDALTCMELIEHVPEPASLVTACAALVKPGGRLYFSTLNRTPAAYVVAVLGAEYIAGLLPRGTHDYRRFVRPHELARWLRAAGCEVTDVRGLHYRPWLRSATAGGRPTVNYLMSAIRTE